MSDWLNAFDAPLKQLGGGELSLADILELLLERSRLAKRLPLSLPNVTLLLSNGQQVTGSLLTQSSKDPPTLSIALQTGSYEQQILFLPTSHVLGITVHDVANWGSVRVDANVPSKADLTQQAQTTSEQFGINISLEIAEDNASRLGVYYLLLQLQEVLSSLFESAMGQEMFKEKVSDLLLKLDTLGTRLEQKQLVVSASSLSTVPTTQQLKQIIEALL
ncbi:MAG: hypothetical protein ACRCYY_19900 [Trueperaceae bacterium]